jgi:hypothetical protein
VELLSFPEARMLLAIRCMSVAFLTGYLVGVPLVWLARRGKPLTTTDWLYAPFVGVGAVTLLAHQLVYLDLRVAWSAPVIWVLVAGLWGTLIARFGWRTAFRECPWGVLLGTLGVYLVHGLGLLVTGLDQYVGRMHTDQYNYISLSQFLIDVPYSTDWMHVGHRAYLVDGLKLKEDRIGVMVLEAFFAVSSGVTAYRTFECTILLSPALVVPAVVLITRLLSFGRWESLLTAIAAALIPGLTTLHTLGCLANVSAIPFVLASAPAACSLALQPSVRKVLLLALVSATTTSLYTEFVPLLAAIVGGAGAFGVLVGRCSWWRTPLVLVAAGMVLVLIYPKTEHARQLGPIFRSTMKTSGGNPFNWLEAKRLPGAAWVYDTWSIKPPDSRRAIVTVIGIGLSAVAVLGVVRLLLREIVFRRPPPGCPNGPGMMALLVASLLAGPPLLLQDGRVDYQGTKLFLSLAPLLVVGVAAAVRAPPVAPLAPGSSPAQRSELPPEDRFPGSGRGLVWRRAALAGLVLVCGYGTCAMVYNLTRDAPAYVSVHVNARNPEFNALKARLRAAHDEDIVLAVGPGLVYNCELAFAARRNRVWLACPVMNDGIAIGCLRADPYRAIPQGRSLVDLTTVPRTAYVLALAGPSAPILIEGDKTLEGCVGPFELWRVGPGPYRLIATESALRPPELDHPSPPKKAQ